MGLLFGGYVSKEASAAFRGRWEKAVRWFRSTYPKLAVQEKCCGPLMIGTGTTCPQDAQEGSGSGWQAVVVGNVADCSLNASDVADLIDVRKVAEKLLREDGRFGAVLWDGGAASAFIVTDWAGWYPIFWAKCNEAMIFSSHLGLLLRLVEPRPQLDPMGVAEQLMMGYQLDARTLFEGISVLRPGEMLLLHSGDIEKGNFRLPFSMDGFGVSPRLLQERFHEALLESVRRRIEGYERVILPLSGGMDSRLIGACLRELGADFETATHNWSGRADWVIAKSVSRRLGSKHHSIPISVDEMAEGVDEAGRMFCTQGPHVQVFYRKLPPSEKTTILLAGNVGDAMEGENLPPDDGSSEQLHDFLYKRWRQALWSDAEVQEIGRELGMTVDVDAVYAESIDVFRSQPALPFQQCLWWDYMGYQRRYITYQNRTCDVHMPTGVPYVDKTVWTELLSWPRCMLTRRRGAEGMVKTFFPDLASIPLAKGGRRSRIATSLWGSLMGAVAWRIPEALQPKMPVCLGGGGIPSMRNWERLLAVLAERTSWLTDKWRERLSKSLNSRTTIRFLALASLLQQIEEYGSLGQLRTAARQECPHE